MFRSQPVPTPSARVEKKFVIWKREQIKKKNPKSKRVFPIRLLQHPYKLLQLFPHTYCIINLL